MSDDLRDTPPQDCRSAAAPASGAAALLAAVDRLPTTIVCLIPGPRSLSLLCEPVSLVVVDPMGGGAVWLSGVSALLQRKPVVPLIVYTAMTPASAQVIAALGHQGLRELVLTPYEDSPERFARTLQRVTTTTRDVSV